MTRRSMQGRRELLSIPTAPQNLLQRLSRPYLQFLSTLAQQPIFTRWHEEVCFFFFFVLEHQPIFTRCQFKLLHSLSSRWKCCLWRKKVEVSSAFRLLVGRWKTTSVVGKSAKNSTDRKLTRRNSTEATIRNLTHNTIKKHVWPPLKLIGCLCVHLICQFSQQNAKKTELACPLSKN